MGDFCEKSDFSPLKVEKVEKYKLLYEPIYVSRGDTPAFDERFIGFGNTRNSQVTQCVIHLCLVFTVPIDVLQVYEMWVAGYSFFLLNNLFTSHWGFQKSSARPSWRWRESGVNSRRFAKFRKEVRRLGISLDSHSTDFTLQISARYDILPPSEPEKGKEKAKLKL